MLRVFLDTDVILNVLCEEEDLESGVRLWPAPKEILNLILDEIYGSTSIINIMEIRSVLAKKKLWKKEEIFEKEAILSESLHVVIPTWTDHIYADKIQKDIFLYPIDCLILALAINEKSILITRDRELLSQHLFSSYNPESFLKEKYPEIFEEKVEPLLKI